MAQQDQAVIVHEDILGFDLILAGKYLRIPSGNEGGSRGNVQWRPGGKTYPGGVPESVIDRVHKGKLNIKEMWSES